MRAGSRGFTVVEILIVVIILGIAAGIVIPMINPDSVKVPAAARIVATDLTYAQNVAQSRQQRVCVIFNADSGKITGYDVKLVVQNPPNPPELVYVTRPGGVSPMTAGFGSAAIEPGSPLAACQLTVNGNTSAVTLAFDAQGRPEYKSGSTYTALTSAATIQVTDLKGASAVDITVQPVTGLVSMPQ